jgi:hypothetical protein
MDCSVPWSVDLPGSWLLSHKGDLPTGASVARQTLGMRITQPSSDNSQRRALISRNVQGSSTRAINVKVDNMFRSLEEYPEIQPKSYIKGGGETIQAESFHH